MSLKNISDKKKKKADFFSGLKEWLYITLGVSMLVGWVRPRLARASVWAMSFALGYESGTEMRQVEDLSLVRSKVEDEAEEGERKVTAKVAIMAAILGGGTLIYI